MDRCVKKTTRFCALANTEKIIKILPVYIPLSVSPVKKLPVKLK